MSFAVPPHRPRDRYGNPTEKVNDIATVWGQLASAITGTLVDMLKRAAIAIDNGKYRIGG